MSTHCPDCKAEIPSGEILFCPHCGRRLKAQAQIGEVLGLIGSCFGLAIGAAMAAVGSCTVILGGMGYAKPDLLQMWIGLALFLICFVVFVAIIIRK